MVRLGRRRVVGAGSPGSAASARTITPTSGTPAPARAWARPSSRITPESVPPSTIAAPVASAAATSSSAQAAHSSTSCSLSPLAPPTTTSTGRGASSPSSSTAAGRLFGAVELEEAGPLHRADRRGLTVRIACKAAFCPHRGRRMIHAMPADHEVVGKTGRVTGRVAPGTVGEVMIAVRGGTEAFYAYPADGASGSRSARRSSCSTTSRRASSAAARTRARRPAPRPESARRRRPGRRRTPRSRRERRASPRRPSRGRPCRSPCRSSPRRCDRPASRSDHTTAAMRAKDARPRSDGQGVYDRPGAAAGLLRARPSGAPSGRTRGARARGAAARARGRRRGGRARRAARARMRRLRGRARRGGGRDRCGDRGRRHRRRA